VHGFLIRCDAVAGQFEALVGSGGLQAASDGCRVVVAGAGDPFAILAGQLAGRTTESPDQPASLAIWDGQTRTLRITRDRTGLYPLFYTRLSSGIAASPDARALLALAGVSRDFDPLALAAWLANVDSEPETTLYRRINRVPAGHLLTVDPGGERLSELWAPPQEGSFDEREARYFGETLEGSITRMLTGRAGVFLSGGIDSSAVVAAVSRTSRDAGIESPLALCVEIDGASEEREQRAVADELGIERRSRVAAAGTGLLERALDRAAESLWPTGSAWLPVYDDLADDARAAGISSIFDGIGGDELLDAGLRPARRALTHLRIRSLLDLAAAERGYTGGGMVSILRAGVPRRHRHRWQPPSFIAPEHRAALRELAETPRDDLLSTRISAGWEETWDAGLRQGVTYHHPLWTASVVTLMRGLPLQALVSNGQAKSPARSYLAQRVPGITGSWPRPRVANVLQATLQNEHRAALESSKDDGLLSALGVTTPPCNPNVYPPAVLALKRWLRVRV
jgi:asparagine synthetase B (glutamine-hydrolysing)